MTRRDRHEIIRDILQACTSEVTRWNIQMLVGLNYKYASILAKALTEKGFLSEKRKTRGLVYNITADGKKWLELVKQLEEMPPLEKYVA